MTGALAARVRVIVTEIQQRRPTTRHSLAVEQSSLRIVAVVLGDLIRGR
ncbi:MAG TPA: hypothetical protein VHD88_02860 [Pyrinomonadaceae bacterium]|nr:hypothetical protein [Pyrinomonadaceae bacterium]